MQKVNSTLGFLCLCRGASNGYQEYRETEKNIKSKLNVRNLRYEKNIEEEKKIINKECMHSSINAVY